MRMGRLTDHKKSACLFLLVFVSYAFIYMTKNCYSAAMASIVDAEIMTTAETGFIAAAFYLFYAPFQIVGGIAADRYSPAKLILFGMLGAGICNLLIYFVEGYVAMLIIWSINAIAQFGIWPSIFKIVSTQLCEEHRMRGIFYISFSSTVGLLFSYVTAIFVVDWKFNFLLSAIVLFALFVIFFFVYDWISKGTVKEEPREVKRISAEPMRKASAREIISVLIKAGIPLMLIVGMTQSMISLGLKSLAPTMLSKSYESVNPSLANALNIILVLASPVGIFISGVPFFKKFSEPVVIGAVFALMLPLLLVVTFVGDIAVAFIVAALCLLMVLTSVTSIFFSYITKKFEKFGCVATLSGTFNCMSALGIVLANSVFATMADNIGWQMTARWWLILVAAALALLVAAVPIWRSFCRKYLGISK